MESDDNSDASVEVESMKTRHKREKKELLAEIQKLKHSVPKNDKKKKKEVQEKISNLEKEMKERHEKECSESMEELNEVTEDLKDLSTENEAQQTRESIEAEKIKKKIAKAQKRRENKAAKNRERDAMIKQQEIGNLSGKRHVEMKKISKRLALKKLKIFEISSDGNCLYNAVSHQMKSEPHLKVTNESLRRQTADHMKVNVDNYMPFLTKTDTGDPYTHEEYEKYCDDIATTSAWAGHLEIQAISNILKRRIEIIQAEGAEVVLGDEYSDNAIVLPYHRHAFGLGEHYNSVEPLCESDVKKT